MKMWRQGDVLIIEAAKPKQMMKRAGDNILVYGEATGHSHKAEGAAVRSRVGAQHRGASHRRRARVGEARRGPRRDTRPTTPASRSRAALPKDIRRTLEESNLPIEVAVAIADLCERSTQRAPTRLPDGWAVTIKDGGGSVIVTNRKHGGVHVMDSSTESIAGILLFYLAKDLTGDPFADPSASGKR